MKLFKRQPTKAQSAPQPTYEGGEPLKRVSKAIAHGASNRADISRQTGLARSTVDAAIEHLERVGQINKQPLGSPCSGGGCKQCPSVTADGAAGCGSHIGGTGPVALVLTKRPQ